LLKSPTAANDTFAIVEIEVVWKLAPVF